MRKKIILGIVILIALTAAVGGAVYFDKNYLILERMYGGKFVVRTDTARILLDGHDDWDEAVKFTPNLKKLAKLEKLDLVADENMDLKYLSEMNDLNELIIFYCDEYNECHVRFETLPDLPNLKTLWLVDIKLQEYRTNFTQPDDCEYNFDSIETFEIQGNQIFDFDCLKHFKNLKTFRISKSASEPTEEQIEELQSRGINVEIVI